ncbi:hypothetical protein K8U54_15050 [Pseudomonas fulva]|uniref:hypothetical protein n=1 Tax=Pseudomonas fulva TaxID=47880 RepID=UPI00201E3177|nr:hypothetical protein [Pseudomonas fulva]UQY33047.1 hypothetical protein K8U54_15050 [Pseudomonas fulva]
METTQTKDVGRGEREHSPDLDEQVAHHDVPLCSSQLISAVEAVRGPGAALALLVEHLQLRATAQLVFSSYSDCFFLKLDAVDRYQNRRVGLLEAISVMPFIAAEIFKHEISSWTPTDIDLVEDAHGIRALVELGLLSPTP